jgi:beta-glucosidase
MRAPATLHFPPGFLWGTATAAHQVEGGNRNNDWWAWEQTAAHIRDGSRSGAACDWWAGRAEQDLAQAAALGQNSHRLSIEWSRLEPTPGQYDAQAFERYRALLGRMRELGLTPLVTLHHFTLPLWAARQGSWLATDLIGRFRAFVAESVHRLGDLVPLWCTINEPTVLMNSGYLQGRWPPGIQNPIKALVAARNMLLAHLAAYEAIHNVQPGAQAGLVLQVPAFDPAPKGGPPNLLVARLQDWVITEMMIRPFRTSRFHPPLAFWPQWVEALAGASDFFGVNYYGRYLVQFDPTAVGQAFGRFVQPETTRTEGNDWGAPHPAGLSRALLRLKPLGKPLYVTENGLLDNTDQRRPSFLLSHLAAVHHAIQAGADVRGYFHWSLVDNFEWAEGWSTRFGLIEVNPATQARRLKRSGELYAAIARANAITPETMATHAPAVR